MSANEGVKLSTGLADIYKAGNFSKCEINLGPLLNRGGNLKASNDESADFLELSCLDELRRMRSPAFFMPDKIFVRSEMQAMFSKLLTKSNQNEVRKILTGSSGVGKSVLFFLASLRFQLLPENVDKKVAYIRKTSAEENISFFLMEPGNGPFTVKLVYSREVSREDYQTLFDMWKELRSYTKVLKAKDYVKFVDGPRYDEPMDLLNNSFHFLCTSGGYPPLRQEEILSTNILIMSGWYEATIVEALVNLGQTVDQAKDIYAVSGGRIRLAILGMEAGGIQSIEGWFNTLIEVHGQEKIASARTITDSYADAAGSSDALHTRFVNYDGNGNSLLIVDSFYAVTKLRERLDFDDLISSYCLAEDAFRDHMNSARSYFFQEIMHMWFKNTRSRLVKDWVRPKGSAAAAISALDRKNVYWIPPKSKFANIDAAFVCGSVLVCLQYTIISKHSFDKEIFWLDFASHVRATVPFTSVVVWLVSPKGTNFKLKRHRAYTQTFTDDTGTDLSVSISFEYTEVTCDSAVTVNASAAELGFLNKKSYT